MVPLLLDSIKAAHNRHSFRCDGYARLNERVFLENPLYLLYPRPVVSTATSGFKILRPSLKTLYIYYTTGWQLQSPAVVLLCSRKRGSFFFALKTLHIYYTTGLPTFSWCIYCTTGWQTFSRCTHRTTEIGTISPERLNNAPHLLYPRDYDGEAL